jgi:RIP metalloprotease RseP
MSFLALLVLLGVLITVHELGHFLVAKWAGVRVLTFSIGFGPKILRFTRGETEYCLSLLPLGGYVRMYGDDVNEEVPQEERRFAFLEQPFLVKSAIALAGPVANLLLPMVLFFALGVGPQTAVEPHVGTVLPDGPAAVAGVLPGDRIRAVDGEPVADFDELVRKIAARPQKPTRLDLERTTATTTQTVSVTVTPTATPSPDPTDKNPMGRIGLLPTRALPFVAVAADSPAFRSGARPGDRVVSVDGVEVKDASALAAALQASDPARPLALVLERPADAAASPVAGAAGEKTRLSLVVPAVASPSPSSVASSSPPSVSPSSSAGVESASSPPSPPPSPSSSAGVESASSPPSPSPSSSAGVESASSPPSPSPSSSAGVESASSPVSPSSSAGVESASSPPSPSSSPSPSSVSTMRFAVLDEELRGADVARRVEETRLLVEQAVQRQSAGRGLAPLEGLLTMVEPQSPAGARGLKARDHRVVAVDGKLLRVASDLPAALQADVDGIHVVGLVDGAGQGSTFAFRMQKATRRELGGARIFGVALASTHGDAPLVTRTVGVAEAAAEAFRDVAQSARMVLSGYVMLVTGQVGLDQLGGPVMIANLAGEAVRAGWQTFVATMCIVSINLAFLNLLPVPVLDGGHLMLFTIEAVRRRRLTVEARIRATKIGMVLVGALMLVALFNDLRSLFL